MAAVHIGIGHTNDAMITELGLVVFGVDTASESGDHRFDFFVFEHSVKGCFLNVENLASQRKNRLESSVSALLCASACRIALDEVNLAVLGVFVRAVRKFTGKRGAFERALSSCALSCHTRRFSGTLRRNRF